MENVLKKNNLRDWKNLLSVKVDKSEFLLQAEPGSKSLRLTYKEPIKSVSLPYGKP